MIGDLRAYANPNDPSQPKRSSELSIPWLSGPPQHWAIVRSKRLFRARTERARPDDQQLSATQAYGVIPQAEFERRAGRKVTRITQHLEKRAHVEKNDFVISMRSFQGGLERAWASGCIRSSYVVLEPSPEVHVGYFTHLFKCHDFIRALQATSNFIGDGQDLNVKNFSMVDLPLPPLAEQAVIGRFLDHTKGKIERVIRAKRKLVGLLNEQKQAVIHRAVTRGFNPAAKLKPSGIPWLGEVPENWAVLRSKYLFHEVDKRSATGSETHLSMSQKFGLIPSSEIEERRLVSESYAGAKLCERGDLVLNRLKAHLGVFALAPQSGLVSPDYTIFRPARDLEPRYFEAAYRTPACRVELKQRAKGIVQGFWRLYTDDFYDIRMPVPPIREQREIMSRLDGELADVNAAIGRADREIELLREYEMRLTTDVVTGRLDVREAAGRLPEEAENLIPAEEYPREGLDGDAVEVE